MKKRVDIGILLLCLVLHTADSFSSLASDKVADTFLFNYYDLPVELKSLPKVVQYLICFQSRDQFIVPTVQQVPVVEYSDSHYDKTGQHQSFNHLVNSITFSSDGSHLALGTNKNYIIGELPLEGSAYDSSLLNFGVKESLRGKDQAVVNQNFSKLAYRRFRQQDHPTILFEESIDTKGEGQPGGRFIGEICKLFQDTTCYSKEYERYINHESLPEFKRLGSNVIAKMQYTSSGDLVVATTYRKVYLIKKDNTVELIEDPVYRFNPGEITSCFNFPKDASISRYEASRKPDGPSPYRYTTKYVAPYEAVISAEAPYVAFQADGDLIVCNYETKLFDVIFEKSPVGMKVRCISPQGECIFLSDYDSDRCAFVERATHKVALFHTFRRPIMSASFSYDGKYLLAEQEGGSKGLIYYVPSASLIGCLDQVHGLRMQGDNGEAVGAFNRAGTHVATFVGLPYAEPPVAKLSIWKCEDSWKALEGIYKGHITLEQALFIIFLYQTSRERTSLESAAQKVGITRSALVEYLKRVRDSFTTVDQQALRAYIRYVVRREPKVC